MKELEFNRINIKIVLTILIVCFMVCSSIVLADRNAVDSVSYIAEGQGEISSICSQANSVVGMEILVYTSNDGLLSFSNEKYSYLTIDEKREFMEVALLATKESELGSNVSGKVYNFIADQDTTTSAVVRELRSDVSADFAGAYKWFRPFANLSGKILGFLSLMIFGLIGLSLVFDIAYITLPGARVVIEMGKNEGSEKKRPRFVTQAAYKSMIDAETSMSGEYHSAVTLYFKRRIPEIIIMSIALSYLISGQIYDFITWCIDSFAWIFSN